jgi:prepilin-type N-terminal cleavage/methylation domain-containing protein
MKAMVLKRMALKSKDRKGFTLVEVIVVLVILAILMAIAVPALTGYIAKAEGKAEEVETKTIVTAIQSIETESKGLYGIQGNDSSDIKNGPKSNATTNMTRITLATAVSDLVGQPITGTSATTRNIDEVVFSTAGHLTGLTYKTSSGRTVTYDGVANTYTVGAATS